MRLRTCLAAACLAAMSSIPCLATVFSSLHGVVHDAQHFPVKGAEVTVKAAASSFELKAITGPDGEFNLESVPLGIYSVAIEANGFTREEEVVTLQSGTNPVLHFALDVASVKTTVTVDESSEPVDSVTPTTLISRLDIDETPGASRTIGMEMITDYVPGAYMTHDMLHMRGGHQLNWQIDGVEIPNTNIASNLAAQIDPKDIDYLEVQRGSYTADVGDRTYGVFNVVPRTGFERNNQAELVVAAGNFYQTDDAISFGSHTERFAYYASINANRSNLGLQPPVAPVVHDAVNGAGGFGSLIFNIDPSNQLRLITTLRRDYFQIPYDPFPNDIENNPASGQYSPSIGLRDGQHEADAGVLFTWVHTFDSHLMTTVSPFFHYNSGDYASKTTDTPEAATEDRTSIYAGGQATFAANYKKNGVQVGFVSFYQSDDQLFDVIPGLASPDIEHPTANLETFYIDDKFKPFSWLTLSAGMRPTRFAEGNFAAASTAQPVSESAISPRFGATVTIPKLRWTFRAFYGHYYQAPPIETVSGPLLQYVQQSNVAIISLHGERDEEHQFGVTIPYRGWVLDADTFKTEASNFLDHNNIGASNIFFPITVSEALIRAWELTLRSPRFAHRAQVHLAYSNQIAEGSGTITGGLTNYTPSPELTPLDHDQRNTLNVGGDVTLPWRSYASANVYYGSGFTNAFPGAPYPGNYLPQHTTVDLSLGKDFGERFTASVSALNVTNHRVEYDNSLTFGGYHWNLPRQIYVQVRYRFRY